MGNARTLETLTKVELIKRCCSLSLEVQPMFGTLREHISAVFNCFKSSLERECQRARVLDLKLETARTERDEALMREKLYADAGLMLEETKNALAVAEATLGHNEVVPNTEGAARENQCS